MGKPKVVANGSQAGHQLLVNVSGTESEVEQFSLPPPRKGSRTKAKNPNSLSFCCECRGMMRAVFIMIIIAMIGAIGMLGYLVFTLSKDVRDLHSQLNDDVAKVLKATSDLTTLERKETSDVKQLYSNFQRLKSQVMTMNATLSGVADDAASLKAFSQTMKEVKELDSDMKQIKVHVASTVSNFESVEGDVNGAKRDIAYLQGQVKQSDSNLEEVKTESSQVKARIDKAEGRLDDMDKTLVSLDRRTSSLDTVNVSHLSASLKFLETQHGQTSEELQRLSAEFVVIQASTIPGAQQKVNTTILVKQLSRITKAVTLVTRGVKTLHSRVDSLNQKDDVEQKRFDAVTAHVSSLNSSLLALESDYWQMKFQLLSIGGNLTKQIQALSNGSLEEAFALPHPNMSLFIDNIMSKIFNQSQSALLPAANAFEGLQGIQQFVNASMSSLQSQLMAIQSLVYQLAAEVHAEKAKQIMKELTPMEDRPSLPTETKHQKETTATVGVGKNQTTTEAATDNVPSRLATGKQAISDSAGGFPPSRKGENVANVSLTESPTQVVTAAVTSVEMVTPEKEVSPTPVNRVLQSTEKTETEGPSILSEALSPNHTTESPVVPTEPVFDKAAIKEPQSQNVTDGVDEVDNAFRHLGENVTLSHQENGTLSLESNMTFAEDENSTVLGKNEAEATPSSTETQSVAATVATPTATMSPDTTSKESNGTDLPTEENSIFNEESEANETSFEVSSNEEHDGLLSEEPEGTSSVPEVPSGVSKEDFAEDLTELGGEEAGVGGQPTEKAVNATENSDEKVLENGEDEFTNFEEEEEEEEEPSKGTVTAGSIDDSLQLNGVTDKLLATVANDLDEEFSNLDENEDGSLDFDEVSHKLSAFGLTGGVAYDVFLAMDRDNGQSLSETELQDIINEQTPDVTATEEPARDIPDDFYSDGDDGFTG